MTYFMIYKIWNFINFVFLNNQVYKKKLLVKHKKEIIRSFYEFIPSK